MTETPPLISIIIPVYKVEPYLRQCLDSVLAQTYPHWEAICINDGSPDNCGAILDEYAAKDSRFIVIHQENQGVSVARNRGLEIMQGKYVTFIDPDDWIEHDTLEHIYNTTKNGKSELIQFGRINHYPDDNTKLTYILHSKFNKNNEKYIEYEINTKLNEEIPPYACTKAYQCNTIKSNNLKFTENIKICEDAEFVLNYLSYCSFVTFITIPLYHYRLDVGITALLRKKTASIEDVIGVCKLFNIIKKHHPQENTTSSSKKAFYYYKIRTLLGAYYYSIAHSRNLQIPKNIKLPHYPILPIFYSVIKIRSLSTFKLIIKSTLSIIQLYKKNQ